MPGCIVSATTASFRSVEKRRLRATPVITSTLENVSDIGTCLGLSLGPPASAGVRSKRGALHGLTSTGGAGCTGSCTNYPDPDGAGQFTGDGATTWDARISALNTALGGGNMVIYFNLNETKGGTDTLSGVDLLSWAAITLTDDQGILAPKTFYLTSDPLAGGKAASALGGPDPSMKTCDVDPNTPYSGNAACPATLNQNNTAAE